MAFRPGVGESRTLLKGREQRVARLGDPSDPRSWYGQQPARSRDRAEPDCAGIPMLFMGQEFLEDKQWSDNFAFHQDLLLNWAVARGSWATNR